MQFVFGDNRASYAVIYTDDDKNTANRVRELLRFSIAPNEKFNNIGYLPYGTNSNSAFFFCIKKDRELSRSVYFMHGFYKEMNPDYLSGSGLIDDICMKYISQDDYNKLRDGEKFVPSLLPNSELTTLDVSNVSIDEAVLLEIIASIYQKNKVLLAIDDNKYSDDYVALLVKKIFKYLTPSLRKSCSYISAVVNTGSMDFTLKFVPASMVADTLEPFINVDDNNFTRAKKNAFQDIAKFILDLSDENRKQFFDNYEFLFSGWKSIYKKQNFEDYYNMVINNDKKMLEDFFDDYLLKNSDATAESITDMVSQQLKPIFVSESSVLARMPINTTNIFDIEALIDDYNLFINKFYLFTDDYTVQRVKSHVENICNSIRVECMIVEKVKRAIRKFNDINSRVDKKAYESFFMEILSGGYSIINTRMEQYDLFLKEAKEQVNLEFPRHIGYGCFGMIDIADSDRICASLSRNVLNTLSDKYDTSVINISVCLEDYICDKISDFNAEIKNQQMEEIESLRSNIKRVKNDIYEGVPIREIRKDIESFMGYPDEIRRDVDKFFATVFEEQCKKEDLLTMLKKVFKSKNQRIISIASEIENPIASLFFVVLCSNSKETIQKRIGKNKDRIDQMPKEEISLYTNYVYDYIAQEGINCNLDDFMSMCNEELSVCDKKTNLYKILFALKNMHTGKKTGVVNKKGKLILIGGIAAVVLIAAAVALFIVFGGSDKDKDKKPSESTATLQPTGQPNQPESTLIPTPEATAESTDGSADSTPSTEATATPNATDGEETQTETPTEVPTDSTDGSADSTPTTEATATPEATDGEETQTETSTEVSTEIPSSETTDNEEN